MNVIGGKLKGQRLIAAKQKWLRPTRQIVKKSLFDTLGDISGFQFLDLFSGTGSIGIEAVSRGATATMVDFSRDAVRIIAKNISNCGIDGQTGLIIDDAEQFLKSSMKKFDVVFIDPPYRTSVPKINNIIKYTRRHMMDIDNSLVVLEYGTVFPAKGAKIIKTSSFGITVLNYISYIK